jgi:acylphosphatase
MLEFVIKNAKELKLNGIVNNYMLLGIRRRT